MHLQSLLMLILLLIFILTLIMILENPIKERSIHLSYYDLKILNENGNNNGNGKVLFVLKPNIDGYYKNISREWIFETDNIGAKSIYHYIKETCSIVNHHLKDLIKDIPNKGYNVTLKSAGCMKKTTKTNWRVPFDKIKNINDNDYNNGADMYYFIIVQTKYGNLDMYYYKSKDDYDKYPGL